MAFTEVEMAILSNASYLELPDSAANKPLHDFLNENKKALLENLGEGYSDAIDGLLKKIENKSYNIVQTRDDKDGTGFAAFAVSDPSGGVTVACRGTEGFSLDYDSQKDVAADLELVASLQTGQQQEMEKFVKKLEQSNYNSYSFTGHSLGGNLAMYGAICLTNPNKLGGCVTFNAPGFNAAFLQRYAIRISRIEDRMISFQNERDCVSECFNVPGKIVVLECEGWDCLEILGVDAHMLNTLIPNADGTFKRNHTGIKDRTILGYILDKATGRTDEGMGFFSPFILGYDFLKWRQQEAQVICRDFSLEAKEMLLSAAKETEEEKWWQVSRWDCWYKVDKFFGGYAADWDRYSGNIDTYYRKLIDMNDASVNDIEKIFEQVYSIDSSYAAKINENKNILTSEILNKLRSLGDTINPTSVKTPLYGQNTNYTCGSASGNMILDSMGIDCSEAAFWNYANANGQGTYVYRIRQTLNHFIGENVYREVDTTHWNLDEYYNLIHTSIENGYPVQVVMAIPSGSDFGYSTSGHYVVITGVYKNADGEYMAMVNDPYSAGWYKNGHQGQQLEVKLSDIKQYNAAHSGYVICN